MGSSDDTATFDDTLRVVTLNLLNDLAYWDYRAPLVVAGLAALRPDVIALQEVRLSPNNAAWIADQLGGFALEVCPGTARRTNREGLAILTRRSVLAHDRMVFEHQGRVAQRVVIDHARTRWTVCNAHLHWSVRDDRTRQEQVTRLLGWLSPGEPTVLCGDLNAPPHYRAVATLRQRFVWAQTPPHTAADRPTFPTALRRGPGPRHRLRSVAVRLLGPLLHHQREPWQAVLDYIFVDPVVRVLRCDVVLDQPAPHDPRLFPSDHRGVFAELALGTDPERDASPGSPRGARDESGH
jgi:endonuclease/exonuclease/phosphatase family metal-dependent hydrolase